MKSLMKNGLLVLTVVSLAFLSLGGASRPTKPGQNKLLKLPDFKYLDVNTLNVTINSNGDFASSHLTNASGCEWPKGTGKTCIYAAGLWIEGQHLPDRGLRGAFMDQSNEFQPGPLLEQFNTTTNDGSAAIARSTDNKWRLYKIDKRDLRVSPPPADLAEWPGDAGAPNLGQNPDGTWIPKWYGDQMLWTVVNDVNSALKSAVSTSQPMGLEVQCLYFAFNLPGALGNMAFLKWKIINRSDSDYDSTYVSMWSDVDLGNGNDDLPGCDTTLSLGYVYNGTNNDAGTAFAYGAAPPADGYDFFEGPKVPGLPTDSAIVDGKWIKGYKNLPMTACVNYFNGTYPQLVDPTLGNSRYPSVAYDYMKGLAGTVHEPVYSTVTGQQITRWFSGDPTANPPTGDLPSNFYFGAVTPQDLRIMLSSGPFNLAKGDTQEVVCAFLIARGQNNINSITLLKTYDALAQDAFNNNFVLPSPPPTPQLNVSYLPNQIVLDWTEGSAETESYDYKNYKFQAYTLYQGESVNGPWHQIAMYSVKNGVTVVKDYVISEIDLQPYLVPVVSFPNAGLKRYFVANQDFINGGALINGKQYYYALTTWAYNTDPNALANGITLTLEHSKEGIVAVPRQAAVGSTIPTSVDQSLTTSRPADDAIVPQVIAPSLLTGKTYTINPNGAGSSVTSWDLYRSNAGGGQDTLIKGNTSFAGDDYSPYIDGVLFRVKNPSGVRFDGQNPPGWEYTPANDLWFSGQTVLPLPALDSGATSGGLAYPTGGALDLGPVGKKKSALPIDQLVKVQIRFNGAVTQHAYRYVGNLRKGLGTLPPQDSSFIPWMKVPTGPGAQYQGDYDQINVPFTVWSIDPFNGDAANPRQLNVGFIEWNDSLYTKAGTYVGRGLVDGQWDPTTNATGGNEALVIFASTYSPTALPKYTQKPGAPTTNIDLQPALDSLDVMYVLLLKRSSATSNWVNGDMLTLTPNYPLQVGRQVTVVAPAPTYQDPARMSQDLAKINVFPNPYFGGNTAEEGAFNHYVTFSHLPFKATIKIFTITGELVRTIEHQNTNASDFDFSFERWDLRNSNGLPVASGVYLVHIDIPGAGSRVLKVAIIQPQSRPARI